VFVFGAGASAEYRGALGHIPTDSEFFQVVDELWEHWVRERQPPEDYDGTAWNWVELRQTLLRRLKKRSLTGVGLEQAFCEVAHDQYLRDRFTRCIELTLFWRTRGLTAAELPVHTALFKRVLRPNDTCITFNYDGLIEATLAAVANHRGVQWHPHDGYALSFDSRMDVTRRLSPIDRVGRSNVIVLKLHGSLTWLVPQGSGENEPSRVLLDIAPNGWRGPGYCLASDRDNPNRIYKPVFVPPDPIKEYSPVAPLWDKAHAALSDADHWLIMGYSLPSTDQAARALLATTYGTADRRRIDIVTPDRDAAERFRHLLPGANIHPMFMRDYVHRLLADQTPTYQLHPSQ
jgi:hypothetical protein